MKRSSSSSTPSSSAETPLTRGIALFDRNSDVADAPAARPAPLVVLGGVGALGVMALTWKHGPGIGPDSVSFLSAAESVAAGRGYLAYDGTPFLLWPPLLPSLVALALPLGFAPGEALRAINAVAFGLVVLCAGLWLRRSTRSPRLVFLGAGAVLVSPVLVRVSTMAWTEPVFILLVLLALMALRRTLEREERTAFLAAILCSAGAVLTRYIGVAVIAAGVAAFLLWGRGGPARRAVRAAGFAAFSSLPLAAWLWRNYLVSSTLTGDRTWSLLTGARPPLFVSPGVGVVSAGIALLLAAAWVCIARQRGGADVRPLALAGLFATFCLGGTLLLASQGASNPVDYRLLAPLYVPMVLLVSGSPERLAGGLHAPRARRVVGIAVEGGVAALIAASLAVLYVEGREMVRRGAGGYATDEWVGSDLVAAVVRTPPPGRIYSNAPEALSLFGGIRAAPSPSKYVGFSEVVDPESLRAFALRVRTHPEPAYLVWFEDAPYGSHLYRQEELLAELALEPVHVAAHGGVYRIRPR